MKISVLTTIFNEAPILPFFLGHYALWDSIHVLIDRETTDNSAEICSRFGNVIVKECGMNAGLHELEKVAMLENEFRRIDADWIAVLDSDEFLVPPSRHLGFHKFLEQQAEFNVVVSKMFPVYRHGTDLDLNPDKPAFPQRLHGGQLRFNEIKPNVLRPSVQNLTIGCHTLAHPEQAKVSPNFFLGSHWADADPSLSIPRRLNRKRRFSKENLERGWGIQHHNVSASSILQEAGEHMKDPLIEELVKLI